ncbi:hypothetical protein ACQP3F_29810, partial [Escherichia coli]
FQELPGFCLLLESYEFPSFKEGVLQFEGNSTLQEWIRISLALRKSSSDAVGLQALEIISQHPQKNALKKT